MSKENWDKTRLNGAGSAKFVSIFKSASHTTQSKVTRSETFLRVQATGEGQLVYKIFRVYKWNESNESNIFHVIFVFIARIAPKIAMFC